MLDLNQNLLLRSFYLLQAYKLLHSDQLFIYQTVKNVHQLIYFFVGVRYMLFYAVYERSIYLYISIPNL